MKYLYIALFAAYSFALWQWSAAVKDNEYAVKLTEANQAFRKIEQKQQLQISEVTNEWHKDAVRREQDNVRKDREIERILRARDTGVQTNSRSAHSRGDSKPDYLAYRVFNTISRCRMSKGYHQQSIDNDARTAAVLRYSSDEYDKVRSQLKACINTLVAVPCVEIR